MTTTTDAPGEALAPMDRAARLAHLRDRLDGDGIPALLVTNLTNIRYLTGFTGSAGLLFVLPERAVLVTDGRYATQAAEQLAAVDVGTEIGLSVPERTRLGSSLVTDARVRALALEAAHVTWAAQRDYATAWFPGVELLPTAGIVEGQRRVKDAGELDRIAAAAAAADAALAAVLPLLEEGPTEVDFAIALDAAMRHHGADAPGFETIVASGPNAAKPHHRPSHRAIGRGEPVVLDFGASVDGYRSDMTRTVAVGELADPVLRRAWDVVAESQAAGVAAVAAGVAAADVDRACREVIAAAGWADRFVHGTGHGVGLDIHEAPSVAATSTDTLQSGHVVTVEPGVYLPGQGGVRIEDTVVVTDDGCTPLTLTPKDH